MILKTFVESIKLDQSPLSFLNKRLIKEVNVSLKCQMKHLREMNKENHDRIGSYELILGLSWERRDS